jgi:hypothetical protein
MQFDKVELVAPAEARSCRICKLPIAGEYFQIGQAIICGRCATTLSGSPEGRGMFLRALLFGTGAALLGTIVWFVISRAIEGTWGWMAIGVGFLVGVAVRRGGRGLGGWRYQALAMVLTYMSITAANVPAVLTELAPASDESASSATTSAKDEAPPTTGGPVGGVDNAASADSVNRKAPEEKPGIGSLLLAVGLILGSAFVAPFTAGASNILGILIIGIGLYEAWKINRRIPVSGPFRFGPAPKPIIATPGGAPPPAAIP